MEQAGLQIDVFEGIDDGLFGEIRGFLGALEGERKTFVTGMGDVVRSEAVAVVREGGRIVGLSGIVRRFGVAYFRYNVVMAEFQGLGLSEGLYRALLPRLHSHICFFATIMNENQKVAALCRKLGYTVVYRADRFTYLCNSKSPLARWLVSQALRPFMPAALALKQAWDRVVSGAGLSGSGPP